MLGWERRDGSGGPLRRNAAERRFTGNASRGAGMLIWERRERRKPQAPDTEAEDCWRQRVPHSLCADSIRTLLLRPCSLPCSIRLPFRPLLTCLSARVSLAFPPGSHLPFRPVLTCPSALSLLAFPPSPFLPPAARALRAGRMTPNSSGWLSAVIGCGVGARMHAQIPLLQWRVGSDAEQVLT
jgi:hypothetical protein